MIGRRLRDVRRRALARERQATPAGLDRVHVGAPVQASNGKHVAGTIAPPLDELEQMRRALELGLRDYVDKNGFSDVVVGVSGGIDSALTAALAAEALGPSASTACRCRRASRRRRRAPTRSGSPSRSAPTSSSCRSIRSYDAFAQTLASVFEGRDADLTEENLQARIRGVLLMALSNKFGWLLVATGNKSELSVGYATLYGDMAGGFALLKDVYKTDVFRLARHLNERAGRELIPASIIERAPSAELRANQLDEDSLPPYAKLDRVLEAYVELDRSREELTTDGFDHDVVERALADDRPRRVQAPAGAARREAAPEGVRPRPAHADHEPLARLGGHGGARRRRRSGPRGPQPPPRDGRPARGRQTSRGSDAVRTRRRSRRARRRSTSAIAPQRRGRRRTSRGSSD